MASPLASILKRDIYTVEMSIPDFISNTRPKPKYFNFHGSDRAFFKLRVYPQNRHTSDDTIINLCCRNMNLCNGAELTVKLKVSILDSNKQKCYNQKYQIKFPNKIPSFMESFISRKLLIHAAQLLMPNGVLTLFGKIKILNNFKNQNVNMSDEIVNDYGSLLKSGDFSDVRLIVGSREKVEDVEEVKEFAVHKGILSSRSEVFAAMFKHSNTREAQENRVDIPDVRVQVFEQFLQFIYTGKISSLTNEYASELFEVADKYQMSSLKQYCEQYLCSNLKIDTLAKTLLLADMHQASELKSKCLEFFIKNGEQVMKTEGWTKISNKPDLMVDLVRRFVSSQSSNSNNNSK